MANTLDSGIGLGLSPGQGHCVTVFEQDTLHSQYHSTSLHPGVQMATSKFLAGVPDRMLGSSVTCDGLASHPG